MLLTLMAIFACAGSQAPAQTITANYSVTGNAYSPVYRSASTIQLSNGPLDNQLIKNVGVKLERTFWGPMTWAQSEGTYNWYAENPCTTCGPTTGPADRDWGADQVLDDIIARGATPVITLAGYPTWDATDGTELLTGPPSSYTAYETLVEAGLNHLRSKYPNIQYILVSNEPDANGFTVTTFISTYQAVQTAVQAVNASLPAGALPFLLGGPSTTSPSVSFMTQFIEAVNSNNLELDFLDWHLYGGSGADIATDAASLRTLLSENGLDENMPQFVTEWGYTANNDTPTPSASDVMSAATYIAQGWISLEQSSSVYNLVTPFPFSEDDYAGYARSVLVPYQVNTEDAQVYPLYNVYQMMTMQKANQAELVSGSTSSVSALPTVDSTGVAMMVVNTTSGGSTVTLDMDDLPSAFQSGSFTFSEYLVDGTHSNWAYSTSESTLQQVANATESSASTFSTSISMAQNSIVLVVLTPGRSGSVPAAPATLLATPNNSNVALAWSSSSGATSYNIYRGTSSGGETEMTTGIFGTSYTDTSVANGTTYYFEVTAANSQGESGKSNQAPATPTGGGGGGGSISFIGRTQAVSSASSTSVTISTPSTIANGDLMLVSVTAWNSTPVAPSGWTVLSSAANSSSDEVSVFYSTWTTGSPTSYTFGSGNLNYPKAVMRVYSGAVAIDSSRPSPASAGVDTDGTSFALSALSTTATENEEYVGFYSCDDCSVIAGPSGLGEGTSDASQWSSYDGDEEIGTAGTVVIGETATASTGGNWLGLAVTLESTSGSGGGGGGTGPISFVGRTQAISASDDTSVTISTPTGIANGDLMVVSVTGWNSIPTTPTGWTKLGSTTNSVPDEVAVFSSNWSTGSATSYTFGSGNLNYPKAVMRVYSGVSGVDASSAAPATSGTETDGTSFSLPSLSSTAVANEEYIGFFACDSCTTISGPSGLGDGTSDTSEWSSYDGDLSIASAGTSISSRTATASTGGNWVGFVLTLKPSSSGSSVAFLGRTQAVSASDDTSVTISTPTGIANGDLMVVSVTAWNSTPATPTGWTKLGSTTNSVPDEVAVFSSTWTTGSATSYTFGSGNLNYPKAVMRVYSGASGIDASSAAPATSGSDTDGTSFSLPALSATAAANEDYVGFFICDNCTSITGPSGLGDGTSDTSQWASYDGDLLIANAGSSVPTRTATASTGGNWLGFAITVK
jgi:hypothetical protein